MKRENQSKIYVSTVSRNRLKADFGLSDSAVSRMLCFYGSGLKSRRVRSKCVNFYGGVVI
jgi:hypothetical protein